jgi:hypothetical protein
MYHYYDSRFANSPQRFLKRRVFGLKLLDLGDETIDEFSSRGHVEEGDWPSHHVLRHDVHRHHHCWCATAQWCVQVLVVGGVVGCVGHLQHKNKNAQRSAAHEERARAHDQPKTRRTARPKTARASVKRAAVRAHGVQIEAQEERACVNTKNELRSANQAQQKGLIPLGRSLYA